MLSMGKGNGHVSGLLSDYMDKQLNAREQAIVEEHLRSCPACAADLRSLQATVQTLQSLPAVAVPRTFVLQPSFQPRRSPSPQLAFLRLATAVTMAALVLSMAGQVLLRGYQPAMSPAPTFSAATADSSGLREAAPAVLPTQAAAAPSNSGPTGSAAAPTVPSAERSTLAAPKAAVTPAADVTQPAPLAPAAPTLAPAAAAAPAPAVAASPAPTGVALAAIPPAPTATMPAVVLQELESSATPPAPAPAPTAAAAPVLAAAPAPTPAPQANTAASALSLLQVGLAGLLVVLVLALIIAGRRRK